MLNLGVAVLAIYVFKDKLNSQALYAIASGCIALLSVGLWHSQTLVSLFEQRLYQQEVIFAQTTAYQRLVLTRHGKHFSLYINGGLQFDSRDETITTKP